MRRADEAEALLGPVSILCNNAGVAGAAPVQRLTYDLWDWVMGINVNGVINGMQTFVPRMIERAKGGHVVNTASGAGLAATASGTMYATSKYAVVGLSETMHLELQPFDIGVSVLCPDPVRTDIIANTRAQEPPRESVTPDDVGQMVLAAVQANRLYLHTDRIMLDAIRRRTEELLAAMPA
jgi:NAD(P)-dependent dehydrogenase (short-subunit alcohol dehydrogenase family)